MFSKLKFKEKSTVIIIFLVALFLHEICNLFIRIPKFNPDELGAISAAAKIAGCDWSGIWMVCRSNYGVLFGLIGTPLFLFLDNPFLIYQIMLFFMAVFQCISVIISYNLMQKHFKIENRVVCSVVAITSSFVVGWRATNVMNECGLNLCVWALVYFLVVIQENEKKKKYTVCLLSIILIALVSHTRSIIILIALIITLLLYRFFTKKSLVNGKIFLCVGLGVLLIYRVVTNLVEKLVFYGDSINANHNSLEDIVLSLGTNTTETSRFSLEGIQSLLDMIGGSIYSVYVISLGTVILGLIFLTNILLEKLKREKTDKTDYKLFVPLLFTGLALLGTIVSYGIVNWAYSLAAKQINLVISYYFYPRYFGIYIGPMFLLSFVYIYKYKISKSNFFCVILFSGLVFKYISKSFLCSLAANGGDVLDAWRLTAPFTFRIYWRADTFYNSYLITFLVILVLILVIWFLKSKKSYRIMAVFLMAISIYQYYFNAFNFDMQLSNYTYDMINETSEVLLNDEELDNFINNIYVHSETSQRVPYALQFLLFNKKVLMIEENKLEEGDIIFSSREIGALSDKYHCVKLDDNEYWYTNDDRIINRLQSMKYSDIEE